MFDSPPTHIKTYAFKWTIDHLKRKLENPITREGIEAADAFRIKDPKSCGNELTLSLSLSATTEHSYYSALQISLIKKAMTGNEDVILSWSVTVENPNDDKDKMEFQPQKDVVSLDSTVFGHNDHATFQIRRMKDTPWHHIMLYMEVVWPEKNVSKGSINKTQTDHARGVKDMMTSGKYADIKLTCKDKEFDCHKFILAAQSSVFDTMFSNKENLEVKQGVVSIKDMEPEELEALLKFVYTGEFDDEMKPFAKALLAAGDKYDVKDLVALVEDELIRTLNLENAIDIFLLAHIHNVQDLRKRALKTIITNFGRISKQPKWQKLKDDECGMAELVEVFVEMGKT